MIEIYTDGSCSLNTGLGGFGVIFIDSGEEILRYSKRGYDTTNNRMELAGVIKAVDLSYEYLNKIQKRKDIVIYSDSSYCINSINKWLKNWEINQFYEYPGYTGDKSVKNTDMWRKFIESRDMLKKSPFVKSVSYNWVKGHSSNPINNLADKLAVAAKLGKEEKNSFKK